MAVLKGEKIIYAVRFTDELSQQQILRVLYQTTGGRSYEADEVEVNTKDIDGVDYGAVTESISFEGIMATDDPAIDYLKDCIKTKKLAEILEINTDTKEAEVGKYMISSLEFEYPDEDNATYSFEATLVGSTTNETLTEVPAGATSID
ncbi:phage major tail protein, TP901-1 family [Aeribacillus sp. FSL M8-0254]|uniref:phage major tail protein, TP901-1 family n=1 Tax=Aeribacillus sp. FSL M8-0254 TaxID=2954577 RepID=UPI0030FBBD69